MYSRAHNRSLAINQTISSGADMERAASQSHTHSSQSAASAASFLKRRHDDTFPEDSANDEETSPSKKPRSSAPDILPRIHHLQPPPRREARKKRHLVSDRDGKRKKAVDRALVRSFQQIGLLQASTLSNTKVKKTRPLGMALGPSHYNDPSEYLIALPIAQTPDLWDVSEVEEPGAANRVDYVVLEDGQYRFDLASVAYELLYEVLREEEAHMKWTEEVNRSVTADIEEYVKLNPKYRHLSVCQRSMKWFELASRKDNDFVQQWHRTCKDIPFDAIDDGTLDAQVTMSIARAAHLNPLPVDVPEDEIEEFVEKVQRIGFEYHRAHNRKFLYLWKEKVKKMQKLEKYELQPFPSGHCTDRGEVPLPRLAWQTSR